MSNGHELWPLFVRYTHWQTYAFEVFTAQTPEQQGAPPLVLSQAAPETTQHLPTLHVGKTLLSNAQQSAFCLQPVAPHVTQQTDVSRLLEPVG
jgi:hypothetical protein